jgi:DNA-binding HxlR family transcriptional regulator
MAHQGKRSYGQHCALAVALDVVGERWTLLILRELLIRPRRYAELLAALPGIGTNLLAERLRTLTEVGLIQLVDPDERRSGYALTERGRSLEEPVLALARWGLKIMSEHATEGTFRPGWSMLGVHALLDDSRAPATDEDYTFVVDDEIFTIRVRDGHVTVIEGAALAPVLTLRTDAATLVEVGARQLNPVSALVAGRVTVSAEDPEAMLRCLDLMGLSDSVPSGSRRAGPQEAPAAARPRAS